jgi:hypothetical protein
LHSHLVFRGLCSAVVILLICILSPGFRDKGKHSDDAGTSTRRMIALNGSLKEQNIGYQIAFLAEIEDYKLFIFFR